MRSRPEQPIGLDHVGYNKWGSGPYLPEIRRQSFAQPQALVQHLDRPFLRVSHETIYTALHAMPRGELRKELIAGVSQSRKSRRPRALGADRHSTIQNRTSIHDPPPRSRSGLFRGIG